MGLCLYCLVQDSGYNYILKEDSSLFVPSGEKQSPQLFIRSAWLSSTVEEDLCWVLGKAVILVFLNEENIDKIKSTHIGEGLWFGALLRNGESTLVWLSFQPLPGD